MAKNDDKRTLRCSFCGKHQDQVQRLIAGPGAYICNECVHLCMGILGDAVEEEGRSVSALEAPDQIPTPRQIKEYLDLLDLTSDMEVRSLPAVNDIRMRTVIAQPGLRYAQADALIQSLLLDETFSDLSLAERNFVTERILGEIKGRMMEDIVLLETKLANPKKEVFVLQFAIGEFDMVVFDPAAGSCEIYEVKHSTEAVAQQYRHLIDEQKCELTRHRFGPITGKYVLYRGEDMVVENGITYWNVEAYLMGL
jgi:hypothetical protein